MNRAAQESIEKIFGERATFDEYERLHYSHDVGTLPGMVQRLVKAMPDGVVQPENEDELRALIDICRTHNIPMVPRGKATSGYGGVVPIKGGIVVEFKRMRKILDISGRDFTVTVEPGVVWKDLEEALNREGFALRLYPTSAPSSTVGGWVAQGGGGIGSYEYGWFEDNIESVGLLTPSGEFRELKAPELNLASGAEGITGFITRATLRVRALDPDTVTAVAFKNSRDMASALKEVSGRGLPLWSVSFINPEMARHKNQVPPRTHHGHPVHEKVEIPEDYIVIFAYPQSRRMEVEKALETITMINNGNILDRDLASHEWEERFNPMKIKRLGPSLVSGEVVVPLERLDRVLEDLDKGIKHPLVMEAFMIGKDQVVILGFIPHDERTFGYNLAYGLSLSMLKIAKKHGGRAYSTGLYFACEKEDVFGKLRVEKLSDFKKKVDPHGFMNPGKVLGNGILDPLMKAASAFEPLLRALGNLARSPIGERKESILGYPEDVSWYAYACAQCGYCVDNCTLAMGKGWESASPRGKWFFMKQVLEGRAEFKREQVENFLMCTTCERCDISCQLDLPIEPSWGLLRGELVYKRKHNTIPAFEIMAASLRKENNIWARYRKNRDQWVPEEIKPKIKEKAEVGYFAGCTASFEEPNVAKGAVTLLDKAGVEFTYLGTDEACCGIPMLISGKWDEWEAAMRHNIDAMKKRGVKTVVTSCPACWLVWHDYYPQWAKKLGIDYPFEAKNYTEVLSEKIKEGKLKFEKPLNMKVTFHDSCHLGRAGGIYEPPRDILKAIPGLQLVEMKHNREDALCCGSVLTRCGDPHPTSDNLGKMKIDEAEETRADAIVALCPCCQVQLRVSADAAGSNMPVKDLAGLAAESLGHKIEDPTNHVLELWGGVFDPMIALLKPDQMVDLMDELMPEMMEAMPQPFKGMMTAVRAAPAPIRDIALAAMKPLMPKLFPVLLPKMMPKVLPDMLEAVGRRVPLPDYMEEQMPDLMPQVMENLMPNLLPEIAPEVTERMIACIKNGACAKKRLPEALPHPL